MSFDGGHRVRAAVALGGAAALTLTLGSCSLVGGHNEPEAMVREFADAIEHGDATAAAALTSYPNAAAGVIGQVLDGMKAENVDYELSQFISLDNESGFFTMNADWNFGQDRDWGYSVQGSARKLAVGWRILWEPSVVMPALGPDGEAHLVRTEAMPPPTVKDIAGTPMMTEQTINAIKLDPAQMPDPGSSTAAVAKAIESVAPLITGPSLMQQLVVAQGQPITAVSLRDADFEILEPDLTPIPGVVVEKQPKLITVDRRIVSPVLDPLRAVWQDERDATAGWAVQVTAPGQARQQMTGYQGPPGPDITSTLDSRLQLAALDAVVSVGTPAAIVAIQPSSGSVVAVAQNSYANDLGPIAFTQMHPVGENVDLLKAAAAVETNTAVEKVSDEDAIASAKRLGLGVDFAIPGLEQKTAQVDDDRLEVTPFGMALAAAAIARGTVPNPMITVGQPGTTGDQLDPLRADVAERLRALWRESVAKPDFEALRGYADVIGFPAGSGDDRWFVGQRGDLAFAVWVQNADGTNAAVKMAARMMRAQDRPSE
ncbi:MAG TPA: NTF2-like N-terminal transpeptidase domain-containing protein [Aldersonia sp.]